MVTGDKIADLKESYPILQKRPQKVYSHLQKKINLISNIQVLKFSGIPINILLECNKSAYFLRIFFFFTNTCIEFLTDHKNYKTQVGAIRQEENSISSGQLSG